MSYTARTMRRVAFLPPLLLAITAATPCFAQTLNPDPGRDLEARNHFQVGRESFARGDFERAAAEFEQAYELSHRPGLQYNIGTAYERLHRWQEARDAFQRYLELVPDAPDRAEVEGRLRVINQELNRPAAPPPPPPPPPVVIVQGPAVTPDPPRPWRTVFWITGATTVIVGAGTLAVGLLANSRYNDLVATCSPTCRQDDVDDMRLRATIVNIGIIGTSVLAAATVTSLLIDQFSRPRPPTGPISRPSVGLTPLPGGALFAFEGTL